MYCGSGDNGQLTFLDTVSLMSFCISLMNLNENLSQGDKQDLQNDLSEKMEVILTEVHSHLREQDRKLDKILEEMSNDNRRNL